jgi:hypothetical protein
MNTGPARQPPGGAFHVVHAFSTTDATTLTPNNTEYVT